MHGPQILLELDAERRVPIFKCIVCDFETPDRVVENRHVMSCGAMVLREHHGMAKTAWLAGVAEHERRKAERGRKKPGSRKLYEAAVGEIGRRASDGRGASDNLSAPIQSHRVGADQTLAGGSETSPATSVPAPTIQS